MKHEKLPFIIRLYLLMDGIFIGLAVGGALAILNFVAWICLIIACLISYLILDYRYRDSLDEWLKYMRGEKEKQKA